MYIILLYLLINIVNYFGRKKERGLSVKIILIIFSPVLCFAVHHQNFFSVLSCYLFPCFPTVSNCNSSYYKSCSCGCIHFDIFVCFPVGTRACTVWSNTVPYCVFLRITVRTICTCTTSSFRLLFGEAYKFNLVNTVLIIESWHLVVQVPVQVLVIQEAEFVNIRIS